MAVIPLRLNFNGDKYTDLLCNTTINIIVREIHVSVYYRATLWLSNELNTLRN